MQADNPLTLDFLLRYPVDAARVLERLPPREVAIFLEALPLGKAAGVVASMLTQRRAICLAAMSDSAAAELLRLIPVPKNLTTYRLLPPEKREHLLPHLPQALCRQLEMHVDYRKLTAGQMMDPGATVLPMDLTVADAIERIEADHLSVGCELYVVDARLHFAGVIETGRLLACNRRSRLREIMKSGIRPIPARAHLAAIAGHPGWKHWRRLPVIESDDTLVGVLSYERVQECMGSGPFEQAAISRDLLGLFGSYWLFLGQLLASLFGHATRPGSARK